MSNKELFAKLLADYRYKAGMSQKDLAEKSGISLAQIGRYEAGASMPRPNAIASLAKALNIETSNLISEKNNKNATPSLRVRINNYIDNTDYMTLVGMAKKLNIAAGYLQKIILGQIEPPPELLSKIEKVLSQYESKTINNVPLIRFDEIEDFILNEPYSVIDILVTNLRLSKGAYAVRITGDTMHSKHGNITIPNNSIVIFDQFDEYFSGDLVLVKLNNNEITFKMIIKDTWIIYLSSLNDNYKPIEVNKKEIEILGKAVQVIINIPQNV